MITLQQVAKAYRDGDQRVAVLNDVNLTLEPGHSLALTGPSGSGKSTLLNIIAGLLSVDSGRVVIDVGTQSFHLHELAEAQRTQVRRQHIGYVHQFFNLIPTLTVLENILLPAHLNGQRGAEQVAFAQALLADFELVSRAQEFPQVLSGGEQQRVAVARAMITRPAVVLADEPTGNLDPHNSSRVAELLYAATRQHGASLLVATHSQAMATQADAQLILSARTH